ncbi:unnamed protein product [Prorocentrum cordatum]|uniref:Uncharacterized protein n=1 Tax=Prorocentrum cordatum TaxID=2364126 RepID=A0ABN9SXY4_9DINO|nr:unnamed protein product [Polarella glacialis]
MVPACSKTAEHVLETSSTHYARTILETLPLWRHRPESGLRAAERSGGGGAATGAPPTGAREHGAAATKARGGGEEKGEEEEEEEEEVTGSKPHRSARKHHVGGRERQAQGVANFSGAT